MKVNVQVERRIKSLDQCDRACVGCLSRVTCFLDQMQGDDAVNDTQHLARDQRTAGEEKAQLKWKTEHPLAHRLVGEYLISEQGRTLGHAPRAAAGAKTASFTAESDQAFLVASLASYPQKSEFKPATLQVVLEFPLHVVRQYPAFLDKLPSEIRVVF